MSNDRQGGMTLIELVIAIVIISIGLAGVLIVFSTIVRGSADPMERKQMLSIAEGMMEEIVLKPYASAPAVGTPNNACARNTFNDVSDYAAYNPAGGICGIDGTAIPSLATYSVSVTVAPATLDGVAAAKRIAVTVSHGVETLILVGWRTDYGA